MVDGPSTTPGVHGSMPSVLIAKSSSALPRRARLSSLTTPCVRLRSSLHRHPRRSARLLHRRTTSRSYRLCRTLVFRMVASRLPRAHLQDMQPTHPTGTASTKVASAWSPLCCHHMPRVCRLATPHPLCLYRQPVHHTLHRVTILSPGTREDLGGSHRQTT